jgi:hypothetical protein
MDDVTIPSAVQSVDPDHHALIAKMVAIVSEDRTQLRQMVYELARRKLRRDLYPQFEEGDWAGIRAQMELLQAAIHQVEDDCAGNSLKFAPEPPLAFRAPGNDFAALPSQTVASEHFPPEHFPPKHFPPMTSFAGRAPGAGRFLPPQRAIADDFFSRAERLSNRVRAVL